jgi:hypothetical protein
MKVNKRMPIAYQIEDIAMEKGVYHLYKNRKLISKILE